VVSEISLSLSEAILGCKLTVDTIDGKLNIAMKPGVNDGDEFVIKNRGACPF
jgi:DnaJ-class molecular chaperone